MDPAQVDNIQELVDERLKVSLDQHRTSMLQDMESIMEKISSKNSSNQIAQFSNIVSGVPTFKRKSNEEQFKHNSKVSLALEEAEQATASGKADDARQKIVEAQTLVAHRQKLIRMADSSDLGWRLVTEYEANPLADDSDDERRMLKAETRASRKLKAEKQKKSRSAHVAPYRKPSSTITGHSQTASTSMAQTTSYRPGLCFTCGKAGHWKGSPECSGTVSKNKIRCLYACKSLPENDINQLKIETGTNCTIDLHADKLKRESKFHSNSPVGKLKKHYSMWKTATDSKYILDVVEQGYKLPFKTLPESTEIRNNKSARDNPFFVETEIQNLLEKGIVSKVHSKPYIVNPLTVAYNRKGKPRLVLDCRYINPFLHQFKVKFEDIKVAEALFERNSFLFTYDLKGAYHHIDIFSTHRTYLGFRYSVNGVNCYFVYNSLPFGIKTAGHIFTKVLRVVVTFLRRNGHKIVMFLDDGIGGSNEYEQAITASTFTQQSLIDFGFLLADEKCQWQPLQKIEWLGHVIDMKSNHLYIIHDRILRLEKSIASALFQIKHSQDNLVPVKFLASITGQIISLQSVVGNKVRLHTRNLFNCINSRASWNAPVVVTSSAMSELKFWAENANVLNEKGKPFKSEHICMYNIFADASGTGYGGYVENIDLGIDSNSIQVFGSRSDATWLPSVEPKYSQNDFKGFNYAKDFTPPEVGISNNVHVQSASEDTLSYNAASEMAYLVNVKSPEADTKCCLPPEEGDKIFYVEKKACTSQSKRLERHSCLPSNIGTEVIGSWNHVETQQSSTWREAEAVHRVVKTFGNILKDSNVKVYSDNKNVKSILLNGSRKEHVHGIALGLNSFCEENNIVLCPEWIPREENETSDFLSRCFDSDDWKIKSQVFNLLDKKWGVHSIDGFASHFSNNCLRFNSRWWVPGTEAVDAFTQFWGHEINWLVPPPRLVPDCISKMQSEKAKCTLVLPSWKSAPFWPMLIKGDGSFKPFIIDTEN